jgi:hypothetical protein
LTKAQQALANEILRERVVAFYRERENGTMGQPGSLWEIGADGLARCRGPSVKEIVARWVGDKPEAMH